MIVASNIVMRKTRNSHVVSLRKDDDQHPAINQHHCELRDLSIVNALNSSHHRRSSLLFRHVCLFMINDHLLDGLLASTYYFFVVRSIDRILFVRCCLIHSLLDGWMDYSTLFLRFYAHAIKIETARPRLPRYPNWPVGYLVNCCACLGAYSWVVL